MFFPIRTDSPLRSTPYVNWTLIVLNVVVYIAQRLHPSVEDQYALDPSQPGLLQFITYQFLHGSPMHLAGNMLFLYIFGNNVNDKLGQLGYLAFYLAGGICAAIAFIVLGGDMPMVGASGSISAVTGAFLVLLPRTNVTILFFFVLIGVFEISSMWLIIAYFLMDVFFQLQESSYGVGGGVAHTAHIGGTVFGVTVCLFMLRFRLLPRDLFDVLALMDRWNRRRQHRGAVNRGYDPFALQPKQDPRGGREDPMLDQIQDLRAEINESVAHNKLAEAATMYTQLLKIDAQQVLARQTQLDVANELYGRADHANAAAAYEAYLRQYSRGGDQIEHVQLILGLIYARYLNRTERARELLTKSLERLHGEREISIAREELANLPATMNPTR
jgi:membrane associated rhomboid family serine protease